MLQVYNCNNATTTGLQIYLSEPQYASEAIKNYHVYNLNYKPTKVFKSIKQHFKISWTCLKYVLKYKDISKICLSLCIIFSL